MKVNVSLSLKLTLIVILLSAITIASVTYGNIYVQEQFFADANYQRASAIFRHLMQH